MFNFISLVPFADLPHPANSQPREMCSLTLGRFLEALPRGSIVTVLFRAIEEERAVRLHELICDTKLFGHVAMVKIGHSYVLPTHEFVVACMPFSEGFPNLSVEVMGYSVACFVPA